jgi:hypothetical protein
VECLGVVEIARHFIDLYCEAANELKTSQKIASGETVGPSEVELMKRDIHIEDLRKVMKG